MLSSGERLIEDELLANLAEDVASNRVSPLYHEEKPTDLAAFLSRLRPICRQVGVTRIADLTGLDRLGLPVAQAIRPHALSEVTALGRGPSIKHAAVGAIMEALERHYAETIPVDRIVHSSADELDVPEMLFDRQLTGPHPTWRQAQIPWIAGQDLMTGSRRMAPFELVHTHYTDPPADFDGLFLRTTTGLACHSSWHQAVAHGLFECVERDALARAFATHGFFDRQRLSPDSLGSSVAQLAGLLAKHNITAGFWQAPSPTGISVVWCQTIEIGAGHPILALPTEGYSAGPDLKVAAETALLEALATRAGAISGARDDQTAKHYHRRIDEIVSRARALILDPVSSTQGVEGRPVSTLEDLLVRIADADLGPVIAIPLGSNSDATVCCVRILLPRSRPFSIVR